MIQNKHIQHRSKAGNVFHLCVHKTGSQWIRKILSDDRTYCYSGLKQYSYHLQLPGKFDPRKITDRSFSDPFPELVIASPVYIDFHNYCDIPKPRETRAFFIQRDPRDVLVSWYHSMKQSHAELGDVGDRRRTLNQLSLDDGLILAINQISESGLFSALNSWGGVSANDSGAIVVSYESLIGKNSFEYFRRIFQHCDIALPDDVLEQLLKDYSFKNLSNGRDTGDEDVTSHFRKGIHGDWKNLLNSRVIDAFKETTGDLVTNLGYSW